MKSFKNVNVYIEGVGIKKTDLLFDTHTVGFKATETAQEVKLPDGAIVLPAFIDEHIHGVCGVDASDGGDAVKTMARALPAEGTAYFLPTTMTVGIDDLLSAVKAAGKTLSEDPEGAKPLGIHLEGPFISYKHIGAQNPEYLLAPDKNTLRRLIDASNNGIKMITLAPETVGADELIEFAADCGVHVSVGHTDATYSAVEKASALGADCVTHTYNAQRALHHREAGTVGAALLLDGLYAELIADGIHVSAPAMRLLLKNKPRDKVILVTDSIRAKGLGDGASTLGGQKVTVKGGEARLADGTLAGSVLKMNDAVKNLVTLCGASITEAADFASTNPAKHLGVFDELGGIKIGKRASYTVLDKSFDVVMTFRDGKTVYDRTTEAVCQASN